MCDGSVGAEHNQCGCDCGPEFFHAAQAAFGGTDVLNRIWQKWDTMMPYDLSQTKEEYIVTMPLPGFDVKEIQVSVKGSNILIEANKVEAKKDESSNTEDKKVDTSTAEPETVVSIGRLFWDKPHVEVNIPVKEEIDPGHVKAKLSRGLLSVRFQKKPSTKINVEE
jgi:HSP20 family molecular chaperone IbpA